MSRKSRTDIREFVEEVVEDALNREITFAHEFGRLNKNGYRDGITVRKNGEIIEGSTRNTVDLGVLRDSVDVTVYSDEIIIDFDTDYAEFVFEDRPELEEEIIDDMDIEDLAVDLIVLRLEKLKL